MKEKPVKSKLFLNKVTVSCLNEREMKNLKGGTSVNIQIVDVIPVVTVVKPQPDPWKPDPTPWNIINIQIRN